MGAEFLAAEAADTLIVVDDQAVVFDFHRFWWTVGDTVVTADTEVVIGDGSGGQGMAKVMFQCPLEAEINIGHFCLTEPGDFQCFQWNTTEFQLVKIGVGTLGCNCLLLCPDLLRFHPHQFCRYRINCLRVAAR